MVSIDKALAQIEINTSLFVTRGHHISYFSPGLRVGAGVLASKLNWIYGMYYVTKIYINFIILQKVYINFNFDFLGENKPPK